MWNVNFAAAIGQCQNAAVVALADATDFNNIGGPRRHKPYAHPISGPVSASRLLNTDACPPECIPLARSSEKLFVTCSTLF
jgi:hypothetical protein